MTPRASTTRLVTQNDYHRHDWHLRQRNLLQMFCEPGSFLKIPWLTHMRKSERPLHTLKCWESKRQFQPYNAKFAGVLAEMFSATLIGRFTSFLKTAASLYKTSSSLNGSRQCCTQCRVRPMFRACGPSPSVRKSWPQRSTTGPGGHKFSF